MSLAAVAAAAALASPAAAAAEVVTYEVVSDDIATLDVEYVDQTGRRLVTSVVLPWTIDVAIADAEGPTGSGAQLRADWRAVRAPGRWVTARIRQGARLLCQSTLDVGNVTCYGNTPHVSRSVLSRPSAPEAPSDLTPARRR